MRFRLSSGRAAGYRTRGAGRVIALLHPVGLRAEFWDGVVDHLQSSFRMISVDLRGHGESDVPDRPFSLDDAATDVIELLRAVGSPPCVVGGCSMGGMVAQGMALQAPDLVRGLILSNTAHAFPAAAAETMGKRAQAAEEGMPAVLQTTLDRWFSRAFQTEHADVVQRISEWLLQGDPVVHGWSWQAIGSLAYGERLRQITAPTLILTGSDDQSIPAAMADAMMKLLPHARHHDFAGAGHLAPIETPAEYARVVREFCAAI
jgi:3-oxoadipate enol-lactonase